MDVVVEQISFKGLVYLVHVPHLLLYFKLFLLACSFQIKHLPPWQTLHNSSIQDGVQDRSHL